MYFSMVISAHTTNWGSVQIKESSFSFTMLNDIRIQFLHHLFFVVCSRLTNKVKNICIIFKFYIKGIVRMKRKPVCKLFKLISYFRKITKYQKFYINQDAICLYKRAKCLRNIFLLILSLSFDVITWKISQLFN